MTHHTNNGVVPRSTRVSVCVCVVLKRACVYTYACECECASVTGLIRYTRVDKDGEDILKNNKTTVKEGGKNATEKFTTSAKSTEIKKKKEVYKYSIGSIVIPVVYTRKRFIVAIISPPLLHSVHIAREHTRIYIHSNI